MRKPALFVLMLFGFITQVHADSSPWVWRINSKNPDVYYAVTTRNHYLLGQRCTLKRKTCMYLIELNITCKTGREYPGLINSDAASSEISFVCGSRVGKQNVLYLKKFKDVDRILRNSTVVGFAIPLSAGKFKLVNFSLDGCVSALDRMRAAFRQGLAAQGGNSGSYGSGTHYYDDDEDIR